MTTVDHFMESVLPIGYRFAPTDEELVVHYLSNKVSSKPLPAHVIRDIDAKELYSKSPLELETSLCEGADFFFFTIHENKSFHDGCASTRIVENGKGFWKSKGEEILIYKWDGDVFAVKISFAYCFGAPPKGEETQWVMEEYRLRNEHNIKKIGMKEECVLGRIKCAEDDEDYI